MFFALFFLISNAFADPKAITLSTGEPAPFNGTLLNQEAIAKILAESEANDKSCQVKIDLATEIQRAKFEQEVGLITSRNQICEDKFSNLNEDYKKLSLKYNRLSTITPVASGLAFAGGIALTIFIVNSI